MEDDDDTRVWLADVSWRDLPPWAAPSIAGGTMFAVSSSAGLVAASARVHASHRRPRPARRLRASSSSSSASSTVGTLPRRNWSEMTTNEFERLDKDRVIALLPVGATEQHGPHLPVCVDAAINAGVLNRAMELLPPEIPLTRLPPLPFGKSVEHDDFAGTISLGTNTLMAAWTDIGESVRRAGVKKLVLFNSHGGQPQVAEIVARDLRKRLGMLVVTVDWFSFGLPEGMFDDDELRHGLHGGDVETSVMLHLHPDLVDMSKAGDFRSAGRDMEESGDFKLLTPEGGIGFGWLAQDLNPSGATGNASAATAEKGRACVEHAASRLVDLLKEVDDFDVDCVFRGGASGEYCTTNYRRIWPGREDGGGGLAESKYKSHYTGTRSS